MHSDELVMFWKGNRRDYDVIVTKNSNTLYVILDEKRIFLGVIEISNNNQDEVNEIDKRTTWNEPNNI